MSLFEKIIKRIAREWYPTECNSHKDLEDNLEGFLENRGFAVTSPCGIGQRRLDMVVNSKVIIELKRNLSSGNYNTLLGQIKAYDISTGYSGLLAVICHAEKSYWRDLKDTYSKPKTDNGSPLRFIRKEPSEEKTEIWPKRKQGITDELIWGRKA